jgi:hypothetical protein
MRHGSASRNQIREPQRAQRNEEVAEEDKKVTTRMRIGDASGAKIFASYEDFERS